MSRKSTQTDSIALQTTVEAMIRTGEEVGESIPDGREAYINEKVIRKAGANVTGHGGYPGTAAAAVTKKGA